MATIKYHDGGINETSGEKFGEAFVKDSIVEAAIEHLCLQMHQDDLIGLFVREFQPNPIHSKTSAGFGQTVYFSWSLGPCPPPGTSREPLSPLLEEFVQNLGTRDPETGIAIGMDGLATEDVLQKYKQAILQYAEVMLMEYSNNSGEDIKHGDYETKKKSSQTTAAGASSPAQATNLPVTKWTLSSADLRYQDYVEQEVTAHLKELISNAEADTAFCCGGTIPHTLTRQSSGKYSSDSVTIRFDSGNGNLHKLDFGGLKPTSARDLNNLVKHCQPATYGMQGNEVLNKDYRDAMKLDPSHFSTNMHPYDLGILDNVSKTLLPRATTKLGGTNKLRAELYKLNVYSGPSGRFKPHVDTPRGTDHIGSLVICLPFKHEGGDLIVRHQGRSIAFSWGTARSVQWAAFYSNLEHEVEEVVSGHRVTLTYNLFWQAPLQVNQALSPVTAAESLPLYQELKRTLEYRSFLPSGGVIGLHCAHSYAHNQNAEHVDLPRNLKGVDMAFFMACQALGLTVETHPVVDRTDAQCYGFYYNHEGDSDVDEDYRHLREGVFDRRRFLLDEASTHSASEMFLKYGPDKSSWDTKQDATGFMARLRRIKKQRPVVGIEARRKDRVDPAITGGKFRVVDADDNMEEGYVAMFDEWTKLKNVTWLNQPQHLERQRAYWRFFGNEPAIEFTYTSAAVVVRIPSWKNRCGRASKAENSLNSDGRLL